METNLFVELLQVSLGTREVLSRPPCRTEWESLFVESQRQAVLGIMMCAIEKLPQTQHPSKELLLQWVGLTLQIEQQNTIISQACKDTIQRFNKDGYKACVLKGQSNHKYYPERMKNRRSCGDVDVWTVPKESAKHPVKSVLEYIKMNYEMNGLCWLHCNYTGNNGVPVEVHFRPSFMNEPCKNRRFLSFFSCFDICVDITEDEIPALKVDYDVTYQMNHIYRHLIDEGVGLRQVVDYFFLLKTWNAKHKCSKEDVMKTFSRLGMKRFAGALMYVLQEVCGMREEMLLCPASAEDGRFLINEIMIAGNFGHDDPRMGPLTYQSNLLRQISQAGRRFKRNMRFITSYPGEVIWEPFARIYHYVWKKGIMYNII